MRVAFGLVKLESIRHGRLLCPALLICLLFIPRFVWAQQLEIRPLGNDPWLTGPESLSNGEYMLSDPTGLAQCDQGVPLWVMDLGIPIPDEQGRLQMIVGGDTFYRPENAEASCYRRPYSRARICEKIDLPGFFDGAYRSDCRVDADCTGPGGAPLDFQDWTCDRDLGFCVQTDLHRFCNMAYERELLPGVVSFCYLQRGEHPHRDAEPQLHGRAFCQWLKGDHHCLTQLYDDTCSPACLSDTAIPACRKDACGIDCIRSCNHSGYCRHRNQTFHTARVEPDGQGGFRLRLLGDHPELFIPRLNVEWRDVELFGVYPGDYFRDLAGHLYLLADNRTWLASSIEDELRRSGFGIYSISEDRRIQVDHIRGRPLPIRAWKTDRERSVETLNTSDHILFPRGSRFSEVSVVHDLRHDSYDPSGADQAYLYLIGSGPACTNTQTCLRTDYTDQAHLSRIPLSDSSDQPFGPIEFFYGIENGRSIWQSAQSESRDDIRPLFAFSSFRAGNVIHWRGEYWQLSEIADPAGEEYAFLHLLRSPDGINWFDGGSFPILDLEEPRRTQFVYASKWLPPAEAGDDLGFILSHWLSYEGYFLSSDDDKRFRDYNMKTYRLTPPPPRSYLVHSVRYSDLRGESIRLPITLYQAKSDLDLGASVQYCICRSRETCLESCPPWAGFGSGEKATGPWRYAFRLKTGKKDTRLAMGDIPFLKFSHGKAGQKDMMATPADLVWNWEADIKQKDVWVLLRFGLFAVDSENPAEEMLASRRIAPSIYASDTMLFHNSQAWHVTEPVHLFRAAP